jgi:hypothetical protein
MCAAPATRRALQFRGTSGLSEVAVLFRPRSRRVRPCWKNAAHPSTAVGKLLPTSAQFPLPGLASRHMKKRISASIRVNPRLGSGQISMPGSPPRHMKTGGDVGMRGLRQRCHPLIPAILRAAGWRTARLRDRRQRERTRLSTQVPGPSQRLETRHGAFAFREPGVLWLGHSFRAGVGRGDDHRWG